MTAIASSVTPISVTPIVPGDLANAILGLPEKDFWEIVSIRLNLPVSLSQDQIKESGITEAELSKREFWTEECLADELFLQLASTKQTISHDGKSITVYKYYHQAHVLRKWISIIEPAPEFVVDLADLNARTISELKTLEDPYYVLRQSVGRIFENIDFRQYHLSIARKLKVRLYK
jgi:hypothetical protein